MQKNTTADTPSLLVRKALKKAYSQHVFLFPFKWEYYSSNKEESPSDRPDVQGFIDLLTTSDRSDRLSPWRKNPFQLDSSLNYNEYNYFYDFTREVMYDVGEPLGGNASREDKILHHFEYYLPGSTSYVIEIGKGDETTNEYRLSIDSILLNVYNTGVAILSFHLVNYEYKSLQDILNINQFGRRVYVPFFDTSKATFDLEQTQQYELARSISITGAKLYLKEDYKSYEEKGNFSKDPFILPGFIKGLFPATFKTKNEADKNSTSAYNLVSPVQDDRMFVLSWYSNLEFSENIKLSKQNYINNADWYKYLFVDTSSPGCANPEMLSRLIKEHTYDRWLDYGTLYGFCRYAFVCVESGDFARNHMMGMYYKMIELALVQRTSMLKFSDEVTRLSQLWKEKKQDKEITDKIRGLYTDYIRFVNKVYFREVTAQEQGIELYDRIQERFRLEDHIKNLDQELEELHNYAAMLEAKMKGEREEKRNDRLELLTIIGALFLIPSFITGYYGMNIFDGKTTFLALHFLTFIMLIPIVIRSLKTKGEEVGGISYWLQKIKSPRLLKGFLIFVLLPVLFSSFLLNDIILFGMFFLCILIYILILPTKK